MAQAEKDPYAQKVVIRLETAPLVTRDGNRGKGLIFDYKKSDQSSELNSENNMLGGVCSSGSLKNQRFSPDDLRNVLDSRKDRVEGFPCTGNFTAYGSGPSEAGPISEIKKIGKGVMGPKRKIPVVAVSSTKKARRKNQLVIPNEGSSNP